MRFSLLAAALILATAAPALATDPPLSTVRIATGLSRPLLVQHAPGDFDRVFIVEQTGQIKIFSKAANALLGTPFLDLTSLASTSSGYLEYGLLGLVFDPDYTANGFFYIVYTPGNTSLAHYQLMRYHVSANPNVADAASGTPILKITYTQKQHRSSWLEFGQDGYLYLSTGDGGEGDPDNAASNTSAVTAGNQLGLRGKILRIDVHAGDDFPADADRNYHIPPSNPFAGDPIKAQEIWATGLRNAWRCSVDPANGDIWIGDVGQGAREEIDVLKAGTVAPGAPAFFGWRCKEGVNATGYSGCPGTLPASLAPVLDYPHSTIGSPLVAGASVTGGFVYRGCAMPTLRGTYFFADWVAAKIWSFRYDRTAGTTSGLVLRSELSAAFGGITSFGTDALGEIYLTKAGDVWKLIPAATQGPDCNANGLTDDCEVAAGLVPDANHNGVPDSCEPCGPADLGRQGGVPGFDRLLDNNDFVVFINYFFNGLAPADLGVQGGIPGADGEFDNNDFVVFIDLFFQGCP